jgi:hypothetical protein
MRLHLSLVRRTIVHGLEVVHQGQDVTMTHGYSLEYRDLISDLTQISLVYEQ